MTSRKIVTPQSSADKRVAHLSKVLSQIQEEKQIRLARTDFNTFAECVLLDEHGYPVKQDAIHESWTQFIEDSWARGEYPAILSCWGHGKSVQQAIGRVLFELGKDINLRCKVVCNNSTQAAKRVGALKNYIESSKQLRKIFPHLRPSPSHWTNTSFDVEGKLWNEIDHTLEAYGIESRAVGGRADLLIFDDVVDDKSEYSKVYRKMTLDNFENVFMSRLEPKARVVLIGTMWHRSDLHCSLIGREGWRFLIQGVSDDFKFIESIII